MKEIYTELGQDPYIPTVTDQQWYLDASCKDSAPDTMYPLGGTRRRSAAEELAIGEFCASCTVKKDCLADALIQEDRWGIKGGFTEHERAAFHRQFSKTGQVSSTYVETRKKYLTQQRERVPREYLPATYQRLAKATLKALETPSLDRSDIQALNVLSQGFVLGDVAPFDEYDNSFQQWIRNHLYRSLALFEVGGYQGPAFAVRRGIELGLVPFAVSKDPLVERFSLQDIAHLEFASLSMPKHELQSLLNLSSQEVEGRRTTILHRLKARNIAHAVRRAYETGLFTKEPDGSKKIVEERRKIRASR